MSTDDVVLGQNGLKLPIKWESTCKNAKSNTLPPPHQVAAIEQPSGRCSRHRMHNEVTTSRNR